MIYGAIIFMTMQNKLQCIFWPKSFVWEELREYWTEIFSLLGKDKINWVIKIKNLLIGYYKIILFTWSGIWSREFFICKSQKINSKTKSCRQKKINIRIYWKNKSRRWWVFIAKKISMTCPVKANFRPWITRIILGIGRQAKCKQYRDKKYNSRHNKVSNNSGHSNKRILKESRYQNNSMKYIIWSLKNHCLLIFRGV